MKKLFISIIFLNLLFGSAIAQTDTISSNIYQNNNKLGIGISTPTTWLTVLNDYSYIDWHTETSIAEFSREYEGSKSRFLLFGYPDTDLVLPHVRKSVMLYATDDAKDMILCASNPEGKIRFFTQTWANPSSERMVIDSIGFVGIGTTKAHTRLQIADGDIYVSDIEKGIIMKSPDGNCWRGTLDNFGVLQFEPIVCPENVTINVEEITPSNNISVFPNPTDGKITITSSFKSRKKMNYSISNINGNILEHGKLSGQNQSIDISDYSIGVYVINVYGKNGDLISSGKIIKN